MAKTLQETTTYQRTKMWNALGVAVVCFIAMIPAAILSPDDPFGYILGFGFIVGLFGFFDHRKELKRLKSEEGKRDDSDTVVQHRSDQSEPVELPQKDS